MILEALQHSYWPGKPPRENLWFLAGAVAFGLLLWAVSMIEKRLRKPGAVRMPEGAGQRRGDFRVSLSVPAEILPHKGTFSLAGFLSDLSAGGATVLVDEPLPQGAALALSFEVGDQVFERLQASVARCDPAHWGRRHYLHCRFTGLPQPVEQRLLRAVAAREREILKPD